MPGPPSHKLTTKAAPHADWNCCGTADWGVFRRAPTPPARSMRQRAPCTAQCLPDGMGVRIVETRKRKQLVVAKSGFWASSICPSHGSYLIISVHHVQLSNPELWPWCKMIMTHALIGLPLIDDVCVLDRRFGLPGWRVVWCTVEHSAQGAILRTHTRMPTSIFVHYKLTRHNQHS